MIRLAVVGTNFITDRLLSALPLSGQFSLTAVYSRSLARAEEYGKKPMALLIFITPSKS